MRRSGPVSGLDLRTNAVEADQQRRDGLAVVDKEAGWTSHDVVAKARGILHNKKIGHSGTLDPDATGVLLLGVGRATRLLRFLTALPKSYVGEIVLGSETTTLDSSGDVVASYDMGQVTLDQARAAAVGLTGAILQIPPMVSAVKIDGQRLHDLARKGVEVERQPRPVTVHRFSLSELEGQPGVLRAEVDCSSGTYVRTLAHDLGHALGGGAHLRNLRRTAIGSFTLADAQPLDDLVVRPIVEAMRDYPFVVAGPEVAAAVGHGKVLTRADLGLPDAGHATDPATDPATDHATDAVPDAVPPAGPGADGPWAVVATDGSLLAVYEAHRGDTVKPAVVVAPAGGGG